MKPGHEGSRELTRFDYIDLMRGIAILAVVAAHSHLEVPALTSMTVALFSYGQMGVQLFFVASALTLCLSKSKRDEVSHYNFYLRRLFRIAPMYYLGIAIYFVARVIQGYLASQTWQVPDGYTFVAVVENIFFVHGLHPVNFNFVVPGGWSIATEMMFYVLFPYLFALQKKLSFFDFAKLSAAALGISFVAQALAIEVLQPFLFERGLIKSIQTNDHFGFIYSSLLSQLPVFLIGICAYKLLPDFKVGLRGMLIAGGLFLASFYLLAVSDVNTGFTGPRTGYNGLIYSSLVAVAFAIFALKLSRVSSFQGFLSRLVIQVGKVSYSMYLLHFLVLQILSWLLQATVFQTVTVPEIQLAVLYLSAVAATYALASLAYHYVEQPAIAYGKKLERY